MENSNKQMKKNLNLFIILTIVFAIATLFLAIKVVTLKKDLGSEILAKEEVISEKDKMLIQLENLQIEYDNLSKEYTGLEDLFTKEKEKVGKLMKQLKKETGNVDVYKKQVEAFKLQLRDYLSQIEVLQARNQELNEENIQVKSSLDSAMYENVALTGRTEELTSKVQMGSKLIAYEIFSDGIRLRSSGKEIPTKKAKRVEQIRTCFLLSENTIAEKGSKTIYLRIAEPGGRILTKGTDDSYMFVFEGEKIAYSIKQQINYDNKSMDLCMYFDKPGELKPGMYYVDIFVDDYQIGKTSFTLE